MTEKYRWELRPLGGPVKNQRGRITDNHVENPTFALVYCACSPGRTSAGQLKPFDSSDSKQHSPVMLDVDGDKRANGAQVILWPTKPDLETPGQNQLWKFQQGAFLQSVSSGMRLDLDVQSISSQGTARVWVWSANDSAQQRWCLSCTKKKRAVGAASNKLGFSLHIRWASWEGVEGGRGKTRKHGVGLCHSAEHAWSKGAYSYACCGARRSLVGEFAKREGGHDERPALASPHAQCTRTHALPTPSVPRRHAQCTSRTPCQRTVLFRRSSFYSTTLSNP